jgi:hypothetical protein
MLQLTKLLSLKEKNLISKNISLKDIGNKKLVSFIQIKELLKLYIKLCYRFVIMLA